MAAALGTYIDWKSARIKRDDVSGIGSFSRETRR